VPLHSVFPLRQAAAAHEASASGHAYGKIVISMS